MRKSFAATIDVDVQDGFKKRCSELGLPQNVVLEAFMKAFANGEIELKLVNGISVEVKS